MKKTLAKLVTFTIVSLFLNLLISSISYAATPAEELSKFFETSGSFQPCIKDAKETDPDVGYLITIVEEPLSLEQSETTTKEEADFEARICVRNYLSFNNGGKQKVISLLATDCADKIKDFSYTNDTFKDLNVQASCEPVQVYLSRGGTTLIFHYISTIYQWAATIVGLIAVVVIIISGVQISLAGGDTQAIENSKTRILQSLAGIVILFTSALILYTINPTFFTK